MRAELQQIYPDTIPPESPLRTLKNASLSSFDSWRAPALERFTSALTPPSPISTSFFHHTPSHPETALPSLPLDIRKKILAAILLLLLSLHTYDARSRVLLLHISRALDVPNSEVTPLESTTAIGLLEAANLAQNAKPSGSSGSAKWQVPLATVAGAALIGVTGGLAAPLVAAGLSTVLGGLGLGATAMATYLGAAAGSGALMGTLFGAYGARRSNEIAGRYASEVEDFLLVKLGEEGRLRIAIGVTGWIEERAEEEIRAPWRAFNQDTVAAYALRWEKGVLEDLGTGAGSLLSDYAVGWMKGQIIRRTIFATLNAALWPMGLLKAAKVVDNPFSNAMRMSTKTGVVLAAALMERAQGERPVTLCGFSMGGRVVWECCRELARRGGYGIVENVVIMGAPVPAEQGRWRELRSVVAGRVINVYSSQDWVLGFLYRTANLQLGVAGLQEVEVHGVENVDVGERVSGHLKYRYEVPHILREVLGEDVRFEEGDVPKAPKTPAEEKENPVDEEEFEKRVEMTEKELKERQEKREGEEKELKEKQEKREHEGPPAQRENSGPLSPENPKNAVDYLALKT